MLNPRLVLITKVLINAYGESRGKKKQKQKTNMFAFISQITIYAGTNEHSEEISVCVRVFRDVKNYPRKKNRWAEGRLFYRDAVMWRISMSFESSFVRELSATDFIG